MNTPDPWILVVDDDEEDHVILRDYFAELNMEGCLQFALNGKYALDLLSTKADDDLPALIVLDLNMPISNGSLTLQFLKQTPRYRDIPVVIYSTSENANERRKCLGNGAVDYIVKPSEYAAGIRIVEYMCALVKGR